MTLARAAYTAVAFFAMPFAALYLLWRSRRQPEYRLHWAERFGFARYMHKGDLPVDLDSRSVTRRNTRCRNR